MTPLVSDSTDPSLVAPQLLWQPSAEVARNAQVTRYMEWLRVHRGLDFPDYWALQRWSITDPGAYWDSMFHFHEIHTDTPYGQALDDPRQMRGARWFDGATINFSDHLLRHRCNSRPALVVRDETGGDREMGWQELRRQVASVAEHLRRLGVQPGDRVAAYLPNVPETVVAFLAAAAVGAIWSMCAPDMGPAAVLERFRQIEPVVLISVDGYRFGGKAFDRLPAVRDIVAGLPSLKHVVLRPHLDVEAQLEGAIAWHTLAADDPPYVSARVPFEHPLWVVYTSGTTGAPKAIVHSQGGTLLTQLALNGIHYDLGPGDRFHTITTTGWVSWNSLVCALGLGCTVCLYDGSPAYPDLNVVWRYAADQKLRFLHSGASFYGLCMKAGIKPGELFDLSNLFGIGSTGSPLSPEAFEWIYSDVKRDVWLTSSAGSTDVGMALFSGVPTLPVYTGELQCRALGAPVDAWDDQGQPVMDEVGELVVTGPLPSLPLFLWGDDGRRYQESWFDTFPGIWRQGDWVRITPRGGAVFYGRSDATINRHGVRMGSSEFYRVIEALDDVADSLVVDLEYVGRPSCLLLFVALRPERALDDELRHRIRTLLRTHLTPRHVPDEIHAVPAVPRTLTGKKLEVPIKKLLLGRGGRELFNLDTLSNPQSVGWFLDFAVQRGAQAEPGSA